MNPDGPVLKWAGQTMWAGRISHNHPPPVDNLLVVITCGTEVGRRYRSGPVESLGLISPSPPLRGVLFINAVQLHYCLLQSCSSTGVYSPVNSRQRPL